MEIAVVQPGHVFWGNFVRLAKLQCEPHRACYIFHHHRCLDGSPGSGADGEDTVIL